MSQVIGIDLGGSKIALGLVGPPDKISARRRIDTASEACLRSVVERIAIEVEALKETLPPEQSAEAVGIGAPGPVDHVSGDLLTLVNLPGISNTPFRRALQERLELPVALDHDAKVAALGEFHYGAGRGRESMIYIVMGTGVGAAIICQGQLIYGESNRVGETGHMTVDPKGHPCHCGLHGCLETYSSGPALAKHYAAATGDNVSVASAGDLLLDAAGASLKQYSFKAVSTRVKVATSEMGEDAPILGAAWLARNRLLGSS